MTLRFPRSWFRHTAFAAVAVAGCFVSVADTHAAKIENPIAVFNGLDKITGRLIEFDVYIGETVQFGALQVTPRVCYTRPPTEAAKTTAFLEVDALTLNDEVQRIFTGWMFAANPGVHAVEHSVYDVWLVNCKRSSKIKPPEGYSGPAVEIEPERDELAGADFVSTGDIPLPWPNPLRF
ncbi:DUF2155 domain-containing protein [Rhodobacteraceae bacterium RKSG542]|uniref:DUF2155 domain-containing protein n=1 Tax=Pseudovibrio flavus TaxID=2529854 RepID=UPI0012BD7E06|nr:DUF2155 domain-containing protein [Pseudovibrio flavus]MTI17285.1 DUF2155 domain-containing protein [Pseudovibrio flavus]